MARKRIDLSNKEVNDICEKFQNGIRLYELEKEYDVETYVLFGILKKAGIYKPRIRYWTDEEIEYLKKNFEHTAFKDMEIFLNRPKHQISSKAYHLGMVRKDVWKAAWTQSEIDILKKYYPGNGSKYVKENFLKSRTEKSITAKAKTLKIKTREYWTDEEESILRSCYEIMPVNDVVALLPSRSRDSVILHANVLKIRNFYHRPYTEDENEFIKNNYVDMSAKEIGENLNRTKLAIKERLRVLKLHKPRYCRGCAYETLDEFFRDHNDEWKRNSMKNCKYKCIVTGGKFENIHHLYGMNLIINDVIRELSIPDDFTLDGINGYYKEFIMQTFLKKQSEHPLGVCLDGKIHRKFHSLYGYGNNTPEQFEDFLLKYCFKNVEGDD